MSYGRFHALLAPLRRQPELALLAALPFVLLALNPNWIYSRLYHDPWIYFGHMQNFTGHSRTFGDLYPAARLSVLFPGVLAYKLFPAVLANHVLHLTVYFLALGSLYYVVSQTVGRRAGFVASLVCGCHFFFLEAIGWDYADGFIVAYFLAGLACLAKAAIAPMWRGWLALAGAMACAMVVANITAVVLAPLLVAFYFVHNRNRQRTPLVASAGWFALGAVGLFCVFGTINWKINGRFWFLASQFNFARSTSSEPNVFHSGLRSWIGGAYWLVFPALASAGAMLRLGQVFIASERPPRHRVWIAGLLHGQLLLALGGLFALQWRTQFSFLQQWFYVSFLIMPLAFLSLGETWSGWLSRLTPAVFRGFGAALVIGLIASAVVPWAADASGTWGRSARIATVILGVGAIAVPCFGRPNIGTALAAALLLAGLNGLCRHEFLPKSGFPPIHHGVILMDASQALDAERPKIFRAIHDCTQIARGADRQANVWFWFDKDEPLGPVYNNAACTHWWHLRMISREFPSLAPSVPNDPSLQAGRKIMVLSQDPHAQDKALATLRAQGVDAKPAGQHAVGQAPVAFTVSVLEILPRDRAASFPGSAWERTSPRALPAENVAAERSNTGGRASKTVRSQAEPGNEKVTERTDNVR